MKSLFLVVVGTLCLSLTNLAQNLTGKWKGKLTQNTKTFEFEMEFLKIDSCNYSCLTTIRKDGDFGTIKANATFKNRQLYFIENDILDQKSSKHNWCIKSGKLNLLGSEKLSGHWNGKCFPGTISLTKQTTKVKSNRLQRELPDENLIQTYRMDSLFRKFNTTHQPGIAVAVIKNNEVIYKQTAGIANLENGTPITGKTKFNIASVSKQFTAFAILMLEKEGKLTLDDDIRKHVPEVPNFGKVITLRQLLHHTSGIRSTTSTLTLAGWRSGDVLTQNEFLKFIKKQKDLNFNPGDEYSYSNSGFTLLGEVIKRVSGSTYKQFIQNRIFNPLSMKNSVVKDDFNQIIKDLAYSYAPEEYGFGKYVINEELVGSTNIYTSIDDMIKWTLNFSNYTIGDQKIFDQMTSKYILNNGDSTSSSLGQHIDNYRGLNRVYHSGGHGGYSSWLIRFPKEEMSFIILSNDASVNTYKLTTEMMNIYLSDVMEDAPTMKPHPKAKTDNSEESDFSKEKLGGRYRLANNKPGYDIEVYIEDNLINVKMDFIGQHFHIGNNIGNRYELTENPLVKFVFSDSKEGIPQKITKLEGGHEDSWIRVKTEPQTEINLNEYAGTYFSPELQTTYTLSIVEGKLTLDHIRLDKHTFNLLDKDSFKGDIWFLNLLQFERDKHGKITGLKISNLRSKNVFFKKVDL